MLGSTNTPGTGLLGLLASLLLVVAIEDASLGAAIAGCALAIAAVATLRPLRNDRRLRRSMRPRTLYRASHAQAIAKARQAP
jgi:hypothetical protein